MVSANLNSQTQSFNFFLLLALVWLRRTQDVGDELAEMIEEKEDQEQAPKVGWFLQSQLNSVLFFNLVCFYLL